MGLVESVVEEEGLVLVGVDEGVAAVEEILRHLVVLPSCGVASSHESYASDAVDDGVVVAVGGGHAYELGIVAQGGFSGEVVFVADFDGVVGVESYHSSVLDIYGGHSVHGGRDDARVVESYLSCSGAYDVVPVDLAAPHAEVPLADGCGGVACVLEHAWEGELLWIDDEWCVAGEDVCVLVLPGVHAGEESVAAGCAGG